MERVAFENKLNVEVMKLGYSDEFVKQGMCEEIEEKYGLSEEKIVSQILQKKEELKENEHFMEYITKSLSQEAVVDFLVKNAKIK